MRILYIFPEPLPLPKARGIQVVNTVHAIALKLGFTGTSENIQSGIGLLLILTAALLLNKTVAFPGWWALLPTAGAYLIISGGPNAWINRHALSWRPLVFIGLISYPLYLWHWPILFFARISPVRKRP